MAKRRRKTKSSFNGIYKTENELCEVFIKYAKQQGWKVYPETSKWDIVICKDGLCIGIQAKLKDNIIVLAQALKKDTHLRAVLIPKASKEFKKVADTAGVFVIEGLSYEYDAFRRKKNWKKQIKTKLNNYNKKLLIKPKKLCWLPDVEINVPAGVKSPRTVTEWKIKAIKICMVLNEKGFLTSADFKRAEVSMVIWLKKQWILPLGNSKRNKKYIRNKETLLPDQLYPEILEAVQNNIK